MYSVILLGTGNLAQHLFDAFISAPNVKIEQVYGRNAEKLKRFQPQVATCSIPSEIKDADVYIIAVKDDAIVQVAEHLSSKKGIVVHTSGAKEMDCIPIPNRGVFYPLQTFTEGKPLDFKDIPVCLEVKQDSSLQLLQALAQEVSGRVYQIDSEQRKKLHLAAVFVNNFTNHLYHIGEDICQKEGLSFSLLQPLIQETAKKILEISPIEAQTGPARRGDDQSIKSHLSLLKNQKHVELYTLFSEAIKKVYEEKL
ncbi:Rossmann-like and DUF2520 domain-containing protein [Flagellimonas sp. S3867]|uniref:Rossmann-like and DUF2520 domain-containing protein n=1 Tax=Flagellimonas sp. S3867 TaxID=2768063 RepID=UPI001684F706|nr:DUF2520 domain-containing protein [Flagellimonas sp. S3867]